MPEETTTKASIPIDAAKRAARQAVICAFRPHPADLSKFWVQLEIHMGAATAGHTVAHDPGV